MTEPEATNCCSINFQVFTNNNQRNFITIRSFASNLLLYKKAKNIKVYSLASDYHFRDNES